MFIYFTVDMRSRGSNEGGGRGRGWGGRRGGTLSHVECDAPKPGGPLTTRQPAEYKWRSGYPTPL